MLSQKNNQLICSVGPGMPTGALFRSVWLPALQINIFKSSLAHFGAGIPSPVLPKNGTF